MPDARLAELLHRLDQFLEVSCSPDPRRVAPAVEDAVCDWRRRLVPESLHGRLVSIVGQEPWHLGSQGNGHAEEVLSALARDLLDDPSSLARELPWLCSREARSAPQLGVLLGRLDHGATQLERLLAAATPSRYPGIARGYLRGLVQHHPEQSDRVNELLDRLQPTQPRAVFDLLSLHLDALRPLERLLAMVDTGRLPVEFLRAVAYDRANRSLTPRELRQVLDRLTAAARQGNQAAGRAALDVLWSELRPRSQAVSPDLRSDSGLKALLETVLDLTQAVLGRETHAWGELLDYLGNSDPQAAVGLAAGALASANLDLAEQAQSYLTTVAPRHPDAVMQRFGEALLDPALGWRLALQRLHEVVQALPVAVVARWLDSRGTPAAVALARHLPPPHVDADGNGVVPELTAYVLERFAEDDRVFSEFCAGMHSGKTYWGDSAAEQEREGEAARQFLDHPLRRVRDWAQYEIERAPHEASWWRARDEEMNIP